MGHLGLFLASAAATWALYSASRAWKNAWRRQKSPMLHGFPCLVVSVDTFKVKSVLGRKVILTFPWQLISFDHNFLKILKRANM